MQSPEQLHITNKAKKHKEGMSADASSSAEAMEDRKALAGRSAVENLEFEPAQILLRKTWAGELVTL